VAKQKRRKRQTQRGPAVGTASGSKERLTFLPQIAAAFCLLLGSVCYVVFNLMDPQETVEIAKNTEQMINRAPYILSVMFLWFALVGMLWQTYTTGKWLRRPRHADKLAWVLLAASLPPLLVSLVAGMMKASIWVVLIPLAVTTLAASLLTVRLKRRPLAEGLLLGLLPLIGLIVEAFLPDRPDPPPPGRPTPSR